MGNAQSLRVGSLCSGYGGLEMGAELAFGPLEHVWHGEFDAAPSAVLAHRWPGTPNLGDIAAVTATNGWVGLDPIDLLLAGYPCQPFSSAGLRKGLDDPRNRWPDVAAAIRALRPRIVFLENVRGHLNRGFDTVVASLAGLGYVGRWRCVRASDAGAAHRRERLFILAWPEEEAPPRLRGADPVGLTADVALLPTPTAERAGYNQGGAAGRVGPVRPSLDQIDRLLPTPTATDGLGGAKTVVNGRTGADHGPRLRDVIDCLLPTPVSSLGRGSGFPSPETAAARRDSCDRTFGLDDAVALLPTPTVADSRNTRNATANRGTVGPRTNNDGWTLCDVAHAGRWGDYAPAVARWERIVGRPAPEPTVPGKNRPQLSPLFVEWLMGLPRGHVTDVVTNRGAALKVLGNGVVPQAAALALNLLTADVPALKAEQLDLLEMAA